MRGVLLCMTCGESAPLADWEKRDGCPACGDTEHPAADLDNPVTVTITAHELRILAFWADNWANQCGGHAPKAMTVIRGRLATQTDAALSLSQEIADLRAAFPDSTVNVIDAASGGEVDL